MTDRRNFLKQTGLLSAAGIISANQIAMAKNRLQPMPRHHQNGRMAQGW